MSGTPAVAKDTILVTAHAWYGDMVGGAFRLASEFARYLAAEGHDVVYVCCDVSTEAHRPASECIDGVEVRRYAPSAARFGAARATRHIAGTSRLVSALLNERRVVTLSGHSPLQCLGAARALRGSGAFINFTVHSPFDDELLANERTAGTWFAARMARWIDKWNITLADRVQTDSHFTQAVLIEKHGRAMAGKGITSPGWVDMDRFRPMRQRDRLSAEHGSEWVGTGPIFFTLRRLEPRMGLDTLIEAAAMLHRRGSDFRVLIGGDGSLRVRLQTLIRDRGLTERVRLLGRVPEEALPLWYGAADCFVLPTRALECFGLIVLEAFACGTPVIASRVGAIPELAAVQGEEWLFAPGNASELADRMQRFLSGQLRTAIDLRAAAADFDRRRILPRWKALLLPGPDAVG